MATLDGFTRKGLAWRRPNTLEADFCRAALKEAIHKFGPPEIMNTDQGSPFPSFGWTDRRKRAKAKSRWTAMPEPWPSLGHSRRPIAVMASTYECVWLHAWGTGSQAKAGVGRWITFTNHLRPHAIRREMGRPDQFQVRLKQGGQPPAVASFDRVKTDQQVQQAA